MKNIKEYFVKRYYANQNNSNYVKKYLSELLNRYDENDVILNIGSGDTRLSKNIINMDIFEGSNIDIVGSAENIPYPDNSVSSIIAQEVFEHIENPDKAIKECFRVLKKGGIILFQVPFIIGYHPGPTDFIRFTKEGVSKFLEIAGFKILNLEISVAGATGFYRIAVEFFAILFSGPISFIYLPLKGFLAFFFYPLKFLDFWFRLSPQKDRIPGGYIAIASKI